MTQAPNMNTRRPRSVISSGSSEITDDAKMEERQFSAFRRSCPSCGHDLTCNPDMAGLPAGLKFDPSDQELIQHLESMVKEGAHPLIDEFIPTIQGEDGICYTHPEKLPGVTRDGLSKHFFHRPSKAYTTGTRKRRKIQAERDLHSSVNVAETRWHKTGKTRPVIVGGRQKGCKKILVLYTKFGKQRKPEKTNWVMHQYHLGDQEEKDGELVVSKVFYQTQPRSAASAAATVEQRTRNGEKVAETSEEMQDVLPGCAATATAAAVVMVHQRQQHRPMQADDHCRLFAPPKKMSHEVGVGDQVAGDQGKQHDNHHIPSQYHVRSDLHAKPVPPVSFAVSTPSNTVSAVLSPAMQHASGVLDNHFHYPEIILKSGKDQEEEQQQQQKVADRRSAGLEELKIACQSTSTEGGASTQSEETQGPYQYWPPDFNQDQHG